MRWGPSDLPRYNDVGQPCWTNQKNEIGVLYTQRRKTETGMHIHNLKLLNISKKVIVQKYKN